MVTCKQWSEHVEETANYPPRIKLILEKLLWPNFLRSKPAQELPSPDIDALGKGSEARRPRAKVTALTTICPLDCKANAATSLAIWTGHISFFKECYFQINCKENQLEQAAFLSVIGWLDAASGMKITAINRCTCPEAKAVGSAHPTVKNLDAKVAADRLCSGLQPPHESAQPDGVLADAARRNSPATPYKGRVKSFQSGTEDTI